MVSVKIMLNKSRIRKDGTYPLVFQIIYRRQKKLIYMDYRLRTEDFDPVREMVVHNEQTPFSMKEVKKMNSSIRKQKKEILARVSELLEEEAEFSVKDIVAHFNNNGDGICLLAFFDNCIDEKLVLKKYGIAAAYKSTQSSIRLFLEDRDIYMANISEKLVDGYRSFLMERKVSDNTIKYYMRNFRSIYNAAIRKGYRFKEKYPFARLRAAPSQTVKRALSKEQMRAINNLELPPRSNLEKYRDLFLFSFFAQGMPFVDLVMLKKENICEGVISYKRYKSKLQVHVKVTEQIQALLDKYQNDGKYVFDIIKENADKSEYDQYRIALIYSNRNLKKIGKMLGFEVPLTTYCARHTWANEAKNSGAPLMVISEGLGHQSEKTTLIYLKGLDLTVLDIINRKVSSILTT